VGQNNQSSRDWIKLLSVESKAPKPRFLQIVEHLRTKIHNGELQEHTALPSERVIGEQFNVSRMTARRALTAMEIEGLAYSSNRKGRFVSPKRITYDVCKMISFSASAREEDIDLSIRLISCETTTADSTVAAALSINEGEAVHKYTRLFSIKGHPIFIEVEYMILALFPDLLEHDLEQSTSRLIEREYNIRPRTGDVVIRMRPALTEEARLLGLATYHPGIELEQVSFDETGRAYCYDCQLWRGELAEFSAQTVVR